MARTTHTKTKKVQGSQEQMIKTLFRYKRLNPLFPGTIRTENSCLKGNYEEIILIYMRLYSHL